MLISEVLGEKLVVDVGVDGGWDEANYVSENRDQRGEDLLYVHHVLILLYGVENNC